MQDDELLRAALKQAGEIALSYFNKGPRMWHKPDGSLLTEADLAVNEKLHDILQSARPDYGWLSEEGPDDPTRTQRQRCWILDPIDGTRSFFKGRDEWCIGLCLVEHGAPILSGVLHPSTQELFFAHRGQGTTRNGGPVFVNDGGTLRDAKIAGRSAAFKRVSALGAVQLDVSSTPQIARMAMLAKGEADAVLSFGPKHDWDIAPGALLVSEAGGKVTDENGVEMMFNRNIPQQDGLVAAGKSRHAALMTTMEKP